jgi:hypothetical protein
MRILFVESDLFARKLAQAATDAEYQVLQRELAENPEKGDVIQGAGGARKVRMALGSQGKRGGARVIYYVRVSRDIIWLLDIYTKGEKADLTKDEKKEIAAYIRNLKGA